MHPLEIEASRLANVIQYQLTRLNLCYVARGRERDLTTRVEFVEPLIATADDVRLEVDIGRLPRGVTVPDLRTTAVLETLAAACRKTVRAEHKKGKNGGFWYVVELEERAALPRVFKYAELGPAPSSAGALPIPIGMGANKARRWEDLRTLPHLLIAGATGQGKSVALNAILCTLAAQFPPDRLRLLMADLKGGMELAFYEKLPHLSAPLVTRAVELPAMLVSLQNEMERRMDLLRGVARDVEGYNYQNPGGRLPYIVCVIDEIANAMLSADKIVLQGEGGRKGSVSTLSESLLADIAARARAVGIHLIVSTQRPSVDVVTGLIKANFPCRVAFGTASEVDSRVIVDDGGAHGLPKGRMLFRRNMELLELQGPWIDDRGVVELVARVVAGDLAAPAGPPTASEKARAQIGTLLGVADSAMGGMFPIRELLAHPDVRAARIGRDKIEAHARRLETEGILSRQWGPRPRKIKAPREQWQAQYPASVLSPDATGPAAPAPAE